VFWEVLVKGETTAAPRRPRGSNHAQDEHRGNHDPIRRITLGKVAGCYKRTACQAANVRRRARSMQQKTHRTVQFEIAEATRDSGPQVG